MARHDVFAGSVEGSYLLDVQADLFDRLKTRVVVPLLPVASTPPPIGRLNPIFEIAGRKVVMATPLLAAFRLPNSAKPAPIWPEVMTSSLQH